MVSKIVGKKVLLEKVEKTDNNSEPLILINKEEPKGSSYVMRVVDYNDDLVPQELIDIGFERGKIIRHDGTAYSLYIEDKEYMMTAFNHILWVYNDQ